MQATSGISSTDRLLTLPDRHPAGGPQTGFEGYRFVHRALPELDFERVDAGTGLLGRALSAPFVVSITGGDADCGAIGAAAQGKGVGVVVEDAHRRRPGHELRRAAPAVPLLLRFPAQLLNRGLDVRHCGELRDAWGADALVLDLRPLEAALEGAGSGFAGLTGRIAEVCANLGTPVLLAEDGHGLAPDVVAGLAGAGVAGFMACGLRSRQARLPSGFAPLGERVAEAIVSIRRAAPRHLVLAGGAVQSGVDAAKAIALGADVVEVSHAALETFDELVTTLRLTMFGVGAGRPSELRDGDRLVQVTSGHEMRAYSETLVYSTTGGPDFIDITADVSEVAARSGIRHGMLSVFCHHTTAAVRINENEPLLMGDFARLLERVAPLGGYDHDDMGRRVGVPPDEPVNGHSHCRQLLLGGCETLPVVDGVLALGTWQSIFLIELDGRRRRSVTVSVLGA